MSDLVVLELKYSLSIMLSFHVIVAKNKYLELNMMMVTCGQGNMEEVAGGNQSHLSQYSFSKFVGS
jgi:hypothetical protein